MFFLFYSIYLSSVSDQSFFNDINSYRTQNNKNILKMNKNLEKVSNEILKNVFEDKDLSIIYKFPYSKVEQMISKNKYGDLKDFAYIITTVNSNSCHDALKRWKRIRGDNEKILGNFKDAGIAALKKEGGMMYFAIVLAIKY